MGSCHRLWAGAGRRWRSTHLCAAMVSAQLGVRGFPTFRADRAAYLTLSKKHFCVIVTFVTISRVIDATVTIMSSTTNRHFGFLLKDLSQRYVARFEQRASEISLTLMQCKVLVHLEKNEGASQARLAELTAIDPMMMVRILDRMEADKLLERRADPQDRRARQLYLTKKAEPLLSEVWRLADLTRSELFAGIGKAERDVFMQVLERLHANACALDETESQVPGAAAVRSSPRRARAAIRGN
jgi:MarR family transcriptional regulator, transcriptional regulator for hemolysin